MNTKIRIAFLIDTINSIGGTEKQLLSLMTSLSSERFEKHLITLRPPNAYFHMDDPDVCQVRVDIPSLTSTRCVGGVLEIARVLRERRIDILQTYFVDAQLVGIAAGRLAGVRKVVCCRRDLGFWHSRALLGLLRLADRFADCFQVNSQAVKAQIVKDELVDPELVHVIYNGVDLELFSRAARQSRRTSRKEPLRVGILANFNRRVKRVDVFLRAAAEVARRVPRARFCIAGGGHLKDELASLSRSLNIGDKVDFLGAITDIPGAISGWDIGVITSDSEGFCNAILEYMASGLPVVATAVGGNLELVEDGVTGFLVSAGDHRELAHRLCELLESNSLRRKMGERGRALMEQRFDWPKVIGAYEAFYRDLLETSHESDLDNMGKSEEKQGNQQGPWDSPLRAQRD
jgi:glycosyltransferase involved in cell wall biosynthesis